MAYLAKECLLLDPDSRPTMSEVVQILSTIAPEKSRRRNYSINLFQVWSNMLLYVTLIWKTSTKIMLFPNENKGNCLNWLAALANPQMFKMTQPCWRFHVSDVSENSKSILTCIYMVVVCAQSFLLAMYTTHNIIHFHFSIWLYLPCWRLYVFHHLGQRFTNFVSKCLTLFLYFPDFMVCPTVLHRWRVSQNGIICFKYNHRATIIPLL